jgi:RecJ-like exonuclease
MEEQPLGYTPCPECRGSGKRSEGELCPTCKGSGLVPVFPAGADEAKIARNG